MPVSETSTIIDAPENADNVLHYRILQSVESPKVGRSGTPRGHGSITRECLIRQGKFSTTVKIATFAWSIADGVFCAKLTTLDETPTTWELSHPRGHRPCADDLKSWMCQTLHTHFQLTSKIQQPQVES